MSADGFPSNPTRGAWSAPSARRIPSVIRWSSWKLPSAKRMPGRAERLMRTMRSARPAVRMTSCGTMTARVPRPSAAAERVENPAPASRRQRTVSWGGPSRRHRAAGCNWRASPFWWPRPPLSALRFRACSGLPDGTPVWRAAQARSGPDPMRPHGFLPDTPIIPHPDPGCGRKRPLRL